MLFSKISYKLSCGTMVFFRLQLRQTIRTDSCFTFQNSKQKIHKKHTLYWWSAEHV